MNFVGERQEVILPRFDRSISIDFQGATITSDSGVLIFREIDERYGLLESIAKAPGQSIGFPHGPLLARIAPPEGLPDRSRLRGLQ